MVDTRIKIGNLVLDSPIILASGTIGYGYETKDLYDIDVVGAICLKGLTLEPTKGNPPPRIVELPSGLLNSIGLQNEGIEDFLTNKLDKVKELNKPIIANISANFIEDFKKIALKLKGHVDAIEINVSCPNIKKGGIHFGTDPIVVKEITETVKDAFQDTVIVKLTPNVTAITRIGIAAQNGGADGLSMINTLKGMAIDISSRQSKLNTKIGGYSGPAIKPVAIAAIYQVYKNVHIPIIGMGGIMSPYDAIEFFLAGSTGIGIGTLNLIDLREMKNIYHGIINYMDKYEYNSIYKLVGDINER